MIFNVLLRKLNWDRIFQRQTHPTLIQDKRRRSTPDNQFVLQRTYHNIRHHNQHQRISQYRHNERKNHSLHLNYQTKRLFIGVFLLSRLFQGEITPILLLQYSAVRYDFRKTSALKQKAAMTIARKLPTKPPADFGAQLEKRIGAPR